jgi:hypothetical protein
VERHVDVRRIGRARGPGLRPYPDVLRHAWAKSFGGVADHVAALHLSARDAAAFAVLLVALTGQNTSTIVNAPAICRSSMRCASRSTSSATGRLVADGGDHQFPSGGCLLNPLLLVR